jgi:hypothetical protein
MKDKVYKYVKKNKQYKINNAVLEVQNKKLETDIV